MATYQIDTLDGASYKIEADNDAQAQQTINDLMGTSSHSAPTAQGLQWSDMLGNVKKGFAETPETIKGMAQTAYQAIPLVDPLSQARSVAQAVRGVPLSQTDTGQAVGNVVQGIKGNIDTIKEIPEFLKHPIQSTKNQIIEHPISSAVNVAALLAPLLAPEAKTLDVARSEASLRASRFAQEQAMKSLEGAMGQVRQLGPEEARAVAQLALDKKIVSPFTPSSLGMERKVAALDQSIGKEIGNYRAEGDLVSDMSKNSIGTNVGGTPPTVQELLSKIKSQLVPDYETGIRAGQQGTLNNAIDEVAKMKDPSFQGIANKATEMNTFAAKNKLMQPEGPTTDVANLISHEKDAALQKALTPEQYQGYQKAIDEFGSVQNMKKFLARGEARDLAGRGWNFSTDVYKMVKDVIGHKAMAASSDTIAKALASPEFAKTLPSIVESIKTAPAIGAMLNDLKAKYDERRKF